MHRPFICTLLFSLAICASAQTVNEPVLKSYDPLVYSPIAVAARVTGEVTVEFSINANGETDAVKATDGPAMLRGSTENFVKSWKFDLGGSVPPPEMKYKATVQYKAIQGTVDPRNGPNLTVHSESFHHFEITILVGDVQLSKCPTGADEDVPSTIAKDDSVELSRYGCMGSCPIYSVRVQATGAVSWNGRGFVEAVGARESSINAKDARDLLEKFRTKEFWSYCEDYTRSITDSSGTEITVGLGGRTRTISDYAESGPKALQELLLDVDRTVDSHRWRHGDPAKEPISRISDDAYLPKPGVTPLMLAAARNENDKLKALIDAGENVNEADASGWSALMYAASTSSDLPIKMLLKAGANSNQSSPLGDTPLIVNALSGFWNEDLVKAGANINAQNKDGRTALMILAARGEPDAISEALKAGADATLKDARGRTALDYLRLASCGKSPIADPIEEWMTTGYTKCTAIDADNLHKSEKLLKNAPM